MDFAGIFQWLITHGYWLMFLAMFVAGPIANSAAAFAAALGYFSPIGVFLVSLASDLAGDLVFYGIGYLSKYIFPVWLTRTFRLKPERITRIQNLLVGHAGKIILAIKLAPVAPPAGLTLIGASRYSIRKFTIISLLISLPKTFLFFAVGYYFGAIYDRIAPYVKYGNYALFIIVLLFIGIYIGYKRWSRRFEDRIHSENL